MTSPDTLAPNAANDDGEHFYELISRGASRSYHILNPDTLPTPVYYIENHESLWTKRFNLILREGDFKDGKVLGVVKMHLRGFTIGLGDPDTELEGKQMIWEELKRHQWTYKLYTFDFGNGAQRATYTYRKLYGALGRVKGMELRAGCAEDNEGQLLAKWVGNSKWTMKPGSMFIRRTETKGQDQDVPVDEEFKKWEVMVCLTMLSIIESQIRRSK